MTESNFVTDEVKQELEDGVKVKTEVVRMTTAKRSNKRGRKPAKVDVKAKLERSRQSARECRARKKLRYQYLEELVSSREKAVYSLRKELDLCKQWCSALDKGKVQADIIQKLKVEQKNGFLSDEYREPGFKKSVKWSKSFPVSDTDSSSDSDCEITEPTTEHATLHDESMRQHHGSVDVTEAATTKDRAVPVRVRFSSCSSTSASTPGQGTDSAKDTSAGSNLQDVDHVEIKEEKMDTEPQHSVPVRYTLAKGEGTVFSTIDERDLVEAVRDADQGAPVVVASVSGLTMFTSSPVRPTVAAIPVKPVKVSLSDSPETLSDIDVSDWIAMMKN